MHSKVLWSIFYILYYSISLFAQASKQKGGLSTRVPIAGRLNSGFDREIGASPPDMYYINCGGLVRASGFRSGFRRPAMWALYSVNCKRDRPRFLTQVRQ
jgi:hypothetical protein